MATPVSNVIEQFLFSIKCYDFFNFLPDELDKMMSSYLKYAIGKFEKTCKSDLSLNPIEGTDQFEFAGDLTEDEINILVAGMVVQWLRPYLYKTDNLRNSMNTKDYSYFSPANLLKEIRETYNEAKSEFENGIIMYTYKNNKLNDLSIEN